MGNENDEITLSCSEVQLLETLVCQYQCTKPHDSYRLVNGSTTHQKQRISEKKH